jgi:hypothetical protein
VTFVASGSRARRVTLAAAGCAVVALLSSACHRSSPADSGPAPAASAAAVRAAPVVPADHLAPGELLEGTDRAFDVLLPRGLRVDGAFSDEVLTSGALAVHPLVDYFRTHVQNGDLREGATSATFEHVTAPGKPERLLTVHIQKAGDGAHVEIRDTTPPKGPPLPDENARWKQVGLTPSGRLVDPTHLD